MSESKILSREETFKLLWAAGEMPIRSCHRLDESDAALRAERESLRRERDAATERAETRRKHTQEWYARHYGKLHDWARKRLPEPWRGEFFNCVANGTWGHEDRGETYTARAGFEITPTNYFRVDTAEGQLILDQTRRAEDAEAELAAAIEAGKADKADVKRFQWLLAEALIDFMIEDDDATFDEIGGAEHADAIRAGIDVAMDTSVSEDPSAMQTAQVEKP